MVRGVCGVQALGVSGGRAPRSIAICGPARPVGTLSESRRKFPPRLDGRARPVQASVQTSVCRPSSKELILSELVLLACIHHVEEFRLIRQELLSRHAAVVIRVDLREHL